MGNQVVTDSSHPHQKHLTQTHRVVIAHILVRNAQLKHIDRQLTHSPETPDPNTVEEGSTLTPLVVHGGPEPSTLTRTSRPTGFKTLLASSISRILKDDDIAKEFDTLRHDLKEIERTSVRCSKLKEKVSNVRF